MLWPKLQLMQNLMKQNPKKQLDINAKHKCNKLTKQFFISS